MLHIKKEICLRKPALSISAFYYDVAIIVYSNQSELCIYIQHHLLIFIVNRFMYFVLKVFRKKVILHIHGAKI